MSLPTVTQTAGLACRDEVRVLCNNHALLSANSAGSVSGAIAQGTTPAKVKTTVSVTYRIDGAIQTAKGATDDFWTLAGTVVAASSWQKYVLMIDSAGAASVAEGIQSLVSAAAVVLPAPQQAHSIVGILTIATDATHTFTPGTTSLTATGITATFVNGYDPSYLTLVTV